MTDDFDPSILNDYQRTMLDRMTDDQAKAFAVLSSDDKAEVMAMHTGQGFVSGKIAPNRPLLRKPAPVYISSLEMLEIVWRKSQWKPDPEFSYGGLAYAYEHTLEIEGFPEFMVTVLSRGFLPAYVKVGETDFRQVKAKAFAGIKPFEALLKGDVVNCEFYEVRGNTLFSDIAPVNTAEHVILFKRDDVHNLACDENAVRDVMRRPESDDPFADKDPELVAHIKKQRADALARMNGSDAASESTPEVASRPTPIRKNNKRKKYAPYINSLFLARVADGAKRYTDLPEMRRAVRSAVPGNLPEAEDRTIDRAAAEDETWKLVSPLTVRKRNRPANLS